MAKRLSIEESLDALVAMRPAVGTPEGKAALRHALASKVNLLAAKAADMARGAGLKELEPELTAAFERFMVRPGETDKGCPAKTAIARALYELGCDADAVFLAGIRHVQMEPSWGGPVDAAAELRGASAMGLVRMGYHDVMTELADLLADPEPQARMAAARAFAYAGRDEGALLLRLKIRMGDAAADVMADCFAALLALAPMKSVPVVAEFMDSPNEEIAQAAALALGESRQPLAFELLRKRWDGAAAPDQRPTLALAIALTRVVESREFLMSIIEQESPPTAAMAITALAIYRHDPAIAEQLRAIIEKQKNVIVDDAFKESFLKGR